MGFAASWFSDKNQAAPVGHKLGRQRRSERRESDGRLIREVEIIDGLEKRKAGAPQQPAQPGFLPVREAFQA